MALTTVGIDLRFGGRRFAYTDALSPNLRGYDILGPPLLDLSGEIYPAARTRIPVLRDLGITAGYGFAFGLQSTTTQGNIVNTTWDHADIGLRARIPLGARGSMIAAHGGFEITRFLFATLDKEVAASSPSVSYKALRAGVDGRIAVGRAALLLDASYDGALSAGAVHARFRGAKVGGVDFGAGIAVAIGAGFEARITARYMRYFYAFKPIPGDTYVAGGALDELFSAGVGAVYAY